MALSEVTAGGDQLAILQAVRDQIAADLDECQVKDKAALYLRLTDVLERIDKLAPLGVRGDIVDEIASRRSARGAGPAAGSARPQRSG